jgi:hypothetical protein
LKFGGKLWYNGGKLLKFGGKSRSFIRSKSFFHTQQKKLSPIGGEFFIGEKQRKGTVKRRQRY